MHGMSALVGQRVQHVDAVASNNFALTRGQPRPWRRVGTSGVESTYWFCGDCGGRAYGQRSVRPDIIAVRAGTLDDTSWLRPAAHVYMRSAQPWEQLGGDAESFEIMPADFWSLAERWQRAGQDE